MGHAENEDLWDINAVKGWCHKAVLYAQKTGLSSYNDISKFIDESKKENDKLFAEVLASLDHIGAKAKEATSQKELDGIIDEGLDEYNKIKHLIKYDGNDKNNIDKTTSI